MATKKKKVDSFCIEEPVINKIPVTNCVVDNKLNEIVDACNNEVVTDTKMKNEDNQNKVQEIVNFLASLVLLVTTFVCAVVGLFHCPIVVGILIACQSMFHMFLLLTYTNIRKTIVKIYDYVNSIPS